MFCNNYTVVFKDSVLFVKYIKDDWIIITCNVNYFSFMPFCIGSKFGQSYCISNGFKDFQFTEKFKMAVRIRKLQISVALYPGFVVPKGS